MSGGVVHGFNEGFRAEDYASGILNRLGTAVRYYPGRDFGIDYFCTVNERAGSFNIVRSYYAVQVKSEPNPWEFATPVAVRWFVEWPMPFFLLLLTKKDLRVRIFQTSPRFYIWVIPPYPEKLILLPGEGRVGKSTDWKDGTTFSLQAPILDFTIPEFEDDEQVRGNATDVLNSWIDVDEENLHLVRNGVRSFAMPDRYRTNELPSRGRVVMSFSFPTHDQVSSAVNFVERPLDWVTRQLFRHDIFTALRGMLLLRQLYWADEHRPEALGLPMSELDALFNLGPPASVYQHLDTLGTTLDLTILRRLGDQPGEHLSRTERLFLSSKDVVDDDLRFLRFAPNLKLLDLSNAAISDAGLKHLEHLTELRYLSLAGTRITDAGLVSLSRLRELRDLYLNRTGITNAGMVSLEARGKLEALTLTDTQVGDDGLESLGKLPALEHLVLVGTAITDQGLEHLRASASLRSVRCDGTQVTESALEALHKQLPARTAAFAEIDRRVREQEERLGRDGV